MRARKRSSQPSIVRSFSAHAPSSWGCPWSRRHTTRCRPIGQRWPIGRPTRICLHRPTVESATHRQARSGRGRDESPRPGRSIRRIGFRHSSPSWAAAREMTSRYVSRLEVVAEARGVLEDVADFSVHHVRAQRRVFGERPLSLFGGRSVPRILQDQRRHQLRWPTIGAQGGASVSYRGTGRLGVEAGGRSSTAALAPGVRQLEGEWTGGGHSFSGGSRSSRCCTVRCARGGPECWRPRRSTAGFRRGYTRKCGVSWAAATSVEALLWRSVTPARSRR